MFARTAPVPLTEVTLPCSPLARAFRVSWKTKQLCGRYFFNLSSPNGPSDHARCADSVSNRESDVNDIRPHKGEVFMRHCDDTFAVFVSGRGRTCIAVTLVDPRGNQILRRQLCHTFQTSDTFVGWPLVISHPLTSPLLFVVDPIFESVPPIVPLTPGCKWTLHDFSSWAERFQPDEEVSSNELNGWFIKLVPRGLATGDEFRSRPCVVISNDRLPPWTTVEVTMNNKKRLAHLRDCVGVEEDSANELVIQVQPYALPRVNVCGHTATWNIDRSLFDAMRDVRSEPFYVVSRQYQLIVGKLNGFLSVFVIATNAPQSMELGFTVSCNGVRVSKTYHFGTSRGIGYPRLCPWPLSGNVEIRFCILMDTIPPVVLSGYKDGQCHKAQWVIPNAREVADRIQLNDEVRSSFFSLLGTRWQICLGLREMHYADSPADPNLTNNSPQGAVAVYLGSESASSALFMLSLGPQRGQLVNTFPMALTWTAGQVWGFKNIASPESILNLSDDGSLTVTLEIFGHLTADNVAIVVPPTPHMAPAILDAKDDGCQLSARSIPPSTRPRADSVDSGIVLYDPLSGSDAHHNGVSLGLDERAQSEAAENASGGGLRRGCMVWISRGLQKLALMADQMAFFGMALVWIDSTVAKKKGLEAFIDILHRKVEPFFTVKGAVGEDDLSITMIDALNARFCEGRSNDQATGEWRRNKFQQRQRLSSTSPLLFGVFTTAACAIDWITSPAGPNFPVIVKPIEGSGSQFCTRCANPSDVFVAYDRALHQWTAELGVNNALLVEEFLQGTEYVVNSVSFGSQHPARILEVWRKAQQYHDNYVLYDRQDLLKPADVPPILYTATRDFLTSLGVSYRASHLEVMVITRRDGELCVECVELNARAAGHASRTMPFEAHLPSCGTMDTTSYEHCDFSGGESPTAHPIFSAPSHAGCGVDNSTKARAHNAAETDDVVASNIVHEDNTRDVDIVPATTAKARRHQSRQNKRAQRRAGADATPHQYTTGGSRGSDSTSNNSVVVGAAGQSKSWERECDAFWRRFGVNQSSIQVINIVHPQAVVPPVPARPYVSAVFLRAPGKGALLSDGIKKICQLQTFFGFDRDLAEFHIAVKLRDRNSSHFWPTSMDRARNLENTFLLTPSGRAQVDSFDVLTTNVEVKKTVDLFTVPGVVLLHNWDGWEAIDADYERIRTMERDGDLYAIEGSSTSSPTCVPNKDSVAPNPDHIAPPLKDIPGGDGDVPVGDGALPPGDGNIPQGDDDIPGSDILKDKSTRSADNGNRPAVSDNALAGSNDVPGGDGSACSASLVGHGDSSAKSRTLYKTMSRPSPSTNRNNQEDSAPTPPSKGGNTVPTLRTYMLENFAKKDCHRAPVSPSPADKAFIAAQRKNERLHQCNQPSRTNHRFAPPKRAPPINQRSCFPYPKRRQQRNVKNDAVMEATTEQVHALSWRKDCRRQSANFEEGASMSSNSGTQPGARPVRGVRVNGKWARGEEQSARKVGSEKLVDEDDKTGAVAGAAEVATSRRKRPPKRRHVEGNGANTSWKMQWPRY